MANGEGRLNLAPRRKGSATASGTAALCLTALLIARVHAQEPLAVDLPARPIGAGDLLAVTVYGAPELTRPARVSGDGSIRLPLLARPIEIRGLLPPQAEQRIAEALAEDQILVDPAVSVAITEYHSVAVSIAGAVRHPLTFRIDKPISLIEALTRAEGLSDNAGAEILITRLTAEGAAAPVERIPVKELMEGSRPERNVMLEGGEQVRVPELGRVFVAGNVRRSGAFRIEEGAGMTVLKAIALAEGLAPFSAKQAYILRREDGAAAAAEIPVELRQITDRQSPDVPLLANDILYIPDSRRARVSANAIEKIVAFAAGTASGALILGVNR